ncbi:MAG: hypothetical protein B7Z21_01640 [Verrucomicrobiales bacterium 32-60-5]|nr:MAG: hypothetical protein B7Z21_01640 [Verrucomicrobiales bacterium 32-60-5]
MPLSPCIQLGQAVIKHAKLQKGILQSRDQHAVQMHARDKTLKSLQLKQVIQQLIHERQRRRGRHCAAPLRVVLDKFTVVEIASVIDQPLILTHFQNTHEGMPADFRSLAGTVKRGPLHRRIQGASPAQYMQFHQTVNPVVEGQKNHLVLRTHQLDRCTTGSMSHGKAAKLLKLFNHNKLMTIQ